MRPARARYPPTLAIQPFQRVALERPLPGDEPISGLEEAVPFVIAALRQRVVGVSARPTTLDEDRAAQVLGLPGDLSHS